MEREREGGGSLDAIYRVLFGVLPDWTALSGLSRGCRGRRGHDQCVYVRHVTYTRDVTRSRGKSFPTNPGHPLTPPLLQQRIGQSELRRRVGGSFFLAAQNGRHVSRARAVGSARWSSKTARLFQD